MTEAAASPLLDPAVHAVIDRVRGSGRPGGGSGRPGSGGHNDRPARDPFQFAERAFPVEPDQGDLMYLLCRAISATRVAESATSLGVSTLYLTAACGTTAAASSSARRSFPPRVGDVLEVFADLGGPVDFLLVDGWPIGREPSLARSVIEMAAPQLRPGAIVVNDNAEDDYLAYVRDPANGFLGMSLPLKGST